MKKKRAKQKGKVPFGILINDWHIGKDTVQQSIENWDDMLNYCEEFNVGRVFVGGDVFLSRVAQNLNVLLAVQQCFKKTTQKGIELIVAPGNHDKVSLEDTRSYCYVFSDMCGLHIVDEYEKFCNGDVDLHIMPYFPENGSFKKRLKDVVKELDEDVINLLYIHEGINGGLGRSDETNNKELPTHIFEDFDDVFVAHYHNRAEIGNNIHYIGSSRQHNFGEDINKGYTIVFEDGTFDFLPNRVNLKYITIKVDFEDINESLFHEIKIAKDDGCRVRVIVCCKSSQKKLINKNEIKDAGAAKVEIEEELAKDKKTTSKAGYVKFTSKKNIETAYKTFADDKNLEDPELGLRYIDKITF